MKPGKHQRSKKDKAYVGRYTTVHNLLFCTYKLCMDYVTNTFLLISSSVNNYCVLCTVKDKKDIKNRQQRTLSGFMIIPLYQLCCNGT